MSNPNGSSNGSEPRQRRTDDDGGKFYEHPSRTEEIPEPGGSFLVRPARYVSVTTALGVVAKPALVFWSANLAARRAMENLPKLIAAARRTEPCGRSRARTDPPACGECAACAEHWVAIFHHGEKERRAREGSAVHDVLEWWILTGEWKYTPREDWGEYAPTPEEMAPYILNLQAFIQDYGLNPESFLVSECTVYNHTFRYAGTLDAVVDIKPVTKKAAELCARINRALGAPSEVSQSVRLLVDAKSREGEGAQLYAEHPLQLAAYRFAETMFPKHAAAEMEAPMIATDGAAILQVRPDGYTFRPVVTDGKTMKAFRAVLDLADWHGEHGERDTQVQAFPKPDGWKWVEPKPVLSPSATLNVTDPNGKPKVPRKRAPRKAPGAKAAPVGTSATLDSMIAGQRVIGAEIQDHEIPF